MKNIYYKAFIYSIVAWIGLLFLVFCFLSFFASASMAKFYDKNAMTSLAYVCYEKSYKNSDDINDLYFLFNYSVRIKNNKKIIKNIEKLEKNDNFEDFIKFLNDRAANNYYLFNEKNYICGEYVKALIGLGHKNLAKENALNNLTNSSVDEFIIFSIKHCTDANIAFAISEIEIIKNKYNELKLMLGSFGNRENVVLLRLCEMAESLNKLTGEHGYLEDILLFGGLFNG